MKVLIADDDFDTLDIVAYVLRREGFIVVTAVDGKQAVQRWESDKPDLVILDVVLPKVNGFEICHKIRNQSSVPVLMLTARDRDDDVVRGLDLGADDYIVKPFSYKQLLARIRAALRRTGNNNSVKQTDQLTVGDMVIDVESHEVSRGGRSVRLTPLEFRMLYCLAVNSGRLVSTSKLIEYVWGFKDGGDANLLKTHICHIRRKLGLQSGKPGYIKNVPGTGYAIL